MSESATQGGHNKLNIIILGNVVSSSSSVDFGFAKTEAIILVALSQCDQKLFAH